MIGKEQLVHVKEPGSMEVSWSARRSVGEGLRSVRVVERSTGSLISNEGLPGPKVETGYVPGRTGAGRARGLEAIEPCLITSRGLHLPVQGITCALTSSVEETLRMCTRTTIVWRCS
jgi:hypothetical protein